MALTLGQIHQQFVDFLADTFAAGEGAGAVCFRFDQAMLPLAPADFLVPQHPEWGANADVARERLSTLFDHVPVECGDGLTAAFGTDRLSDTYALRMLLPSVAAGDAGPERDEFDSTKSAALARYQAIEEASRTGLPFAFKPVLATPADWYDAGAAGNWTVESVTISDQDPQPARPAPQVPLVWGLRESAQASMTSRLAQASASPIASSHSGVLARPTVDPRTAMATARAQPLAATVREDAGIARIPGAVAPVNPVSSLAAEDLASLAFARRMQLVGDLCATAPTRQTQSTKMDASFSYCVVQGERPWFTDAFVQLGNWAVPGLEPGALSDTAHPGGLGWIPVGMVLVKDLNIQLQCAEAERTPDSRSFGPFRVAWQDNRLVHAGMQIVGWFLQRLPLLPPAQPSS